MLFAKASYSQSCKKKERVCFNKADTSAKNEYQLNVSHIFSQKYYLLILFILLSNNEIIFRPHLGVCTLDAALKSRDSKPLSRSHGRTEKSPPNSNFNETCRLLKSLVAKAGSALTRAPARATGTSPWQSSRASMGRTLKYKSKLQSQKIKAQLCFDLKLKICLDQSYKAHGNLNSLLLRIPCKTIQSTGFLFQLKNRAFIF